MGRLILEIRFLLRHKYLNLARYEVEISIWACFQRQQAPFVQLDFSAAYSVGKASRRKTDFKVSAGRELRGR
jgi:hypothetical protein